MEPMTTVHVADQKKIPVRLILPGGGVKAVFQAGFLKEMLNTNLFYIDRVYGCSAGAVLAPAVVTNRIDEFVDTLKNFKGIEDFVEPWPLLPSPIRNNIFSFTFNRLQNILGPSSILRKVTSILYLFFNLGLYKRMTLMDTLLSKLTKEDKRKVEQKVEVVAYDVLNNNVKYFKGKDIFIGIEASSALWLIVPPVKHKGIYYSDGGIIELYPVKDIDPSFHGIYLVVDLNTPEKKPLQTLPTEVISLVYSMVSNMMGRLGQDRLDDAKRQLKGKLIHIYPDEVPFENSLDFNQKSVMASFAAGRIKFHQFLLEHLNSISKYANNNGQGKSKAA